MKRLSSTPYGSVELEASVDPSVSLERAFYRKFMGRMLDIVEVTPSRVGDFLKLYYNLRFDVINLKRILRGKASGFTPERIASTLIPIPPYWVESYESLIRAENIEVLLSQLKGSKYIELFGALGEYTRERSIQPLERGLDRIRRSSILKAADKLPAEERKIIHRIVALEVDVENFLAAIKIGKSASASTDRAAFYEKTYAITPAILRSIARGEKAEDMVRSLPAPYSELLKPIAEGDVALIRRGLRGEIYKAASRSRAENNFGYNAIIAYLVYCETEKDDLVATAWAKEQNVPSAQLLKYLVVPNYR